MPIAVLTGFVALATPQPAAPVVVARNPIAIELNSTDRRIEPLGAGRAWGRLIPMDGPFAEQALSLTRTLTVVGREIDNDLVLDDGSRLAATPRFAGRTAACRSAIWTA